MAASLRGQLWKTKPTIRRTVLSDPPRPRRTRSTPGPRREPPAEGSPCGTLGQHEREDRADQLRLVEVAPDPGPLDDARLAGLLGDDHDHRVGLLRDPERRPVAGAEALGVDGRLRQREHRARRDDRRAADDHGAVVERATRREDRLQEIGREVRVDHHAGLRDLLEAGFPLHDHQGPESRARQVGRSARHGEGHLLGAPLVGGRGEPGERSNPSDPLEGAAELGLEDDHEREQADDRTGLHELGEQAQAHGLGDRIDQEDHAAADHEPDCARPAYQAEEPVDDERGDRDVDERDRSNLSDQRLEELRHRPVSVAPGSVTTSGVATSARSRHPLRDLEARPAAPRRQAGANRGSSGKASRAAARMRSRAAASPSISTRCTRPRYVSPAKPLAPRSSASSAIRRWRSTSPGPTPRASTHTSSAATGCPAARYARAAAIAAATAPCRSPRAAASSAARASGSPSTYRAAASIPGTLPPVSGASAAPGDSSATSAAAAPDSSAGTVSAGASKGGATSGWVSRGTGARASARSASASPATRRSSSVRSRYRSRRACVGWISRARRVAGKHAEACDALRRASASSSKVAAASSGR